MAAASCGLDASLLQRVAPADADIPTVDAGGPTVDAIGPPAPISGTTLAAGEYHTCALVADEVYCWGNNAAAQIAPPSSTSVPTPKPVAIAEPVDTLCAGETHSCALSRTGSVWCWGGNARGQLGRGAGAVDPAPARAHLPSAVTVLACGIEHNCAVVTDGSLWCWGSSQESQLGIGSYGDSRPEPIQVGTDRDWMFVAAGQGHTCGLRTPGRLYCWGRNTAFQLGLGPGQPGNLGTPILVSTDEDWIGVSLRQEGTCGLKRDHSLLCWGDNTSAQLGDAGAATEVPTRFGTRSDWRVIRAGTFHSCGLTTANALACWGRNIEGQLAFGDFSEHAVPPDTMLPGRWTEVTVGRFHTCARSEAGTIACAGKNAVSELGLGLPDYAIPGFTTLTFGGPHPAP